MCGIATVAIGRDKRDKLDFNKMRSLVTELLIELEDRGRHATGIAIVNEPGSDYPSVAFKMPIRAERFVLRPRFKDTLENIGPDTNFILLHTRLATRGDNSVLENNHPICIPSIVGIHNGTVENSEELFSKHLEECGRSAEVDSEVIFRLFRMYSLRGMLAKEAMQETARHMTGAFTGALVDWFNPKQLVMFKFVRPLAMINIPYYDVSLTISEEHMYHKAAKRLNMKRLKTHSHHVMDGSGLLFDLDSGKSLIKSITEFTLPIENPDKYLRKYSSYFQSHSSV